MRYRVWCWIDANVPYYRTYDYTKGKDEKGREIVRGAGARDSWQVDGIWSQANWSKHYPNSPNLMYDGKPLFESTDDPDYQTLLNAIKAASNRLCAAPRKDITVD